MKVCMLAYTYYDNDNRVMRYAEALAQRGDRVDVIALRKKGQVAREVIRGVNVYRIQRRVVNETHPISYLLKILFFLFNSALRIAMMHLRGKYDVVHIHSIPDFLVFSALVPKLLGAKCILDVHDIVPEFYAAKFGIGQEALIFRSLVAVESLSARFVNHVIVANHIWAERLVSRSVPQEKCSVFMNYPDQSLFRKPSEVAKNDHFVMLYPGTLNHHQGLDIAIRAMKILEVKAPDARLHIYGDGAEKNALIQLAAELNLEERVLFYDLVPLDEIAAVMAAADLGLVPKRADSFGNEAFSTKILEFMSLGVPLVAAGTMIDKYYFDESEIQFFESGNEEDLARCLLLLIENPQLRSDMARTAEECAEQYSWDQHRQRYLDLVDTLATGSTVGEQSGD